MTIFNEKSNEQRHPSVSLCLCLSLSLSVTLDFMAHSLCRLITKMFLTKTTCLIKFYKIVTHNGVKTSHLRIQIFIKYIKTNQEQTKKINVLPVISKSKCRAELFCKKGVLKSLTKFTGKHLCQSPVFNKNADLRNATLLKKRLWHSYFPVNFVKFLWTPFCIAHLWWQLL